MRTLTPVDPTELASLGETLSPFSIDGKLQGAKRLYQGHLHATYVGEWSNPDGVVHRFIHQRINTEAFPETKGMLENTVAVLDFLNSRPDYSFPAKLILVPTKETGFFLERENEYWRSYKYVEGSISHDTCPDIAFAESLGRATGDFLYLLSGLSIEDLADHSPGFQNTEVRWEQLQGALVDAENERREESAELLKEVEQVRSEAVRISQAISSGKLREQVIHGDTKINNFLFSESSSEVLCLVDVDLCMRGSPLVDFGDLVRSACAIGREDEPDLDQVGVDPSLISSVTKGFLESQLELTEEERELLPLAGFTISFNLTIRFLADYLGGDRYFPVTRPHHNLERAKAQVDLFRLSNLAEDQKARP